MWVYIKIVNALFLILLLIKVAQPIYAQTSTVPLQQASRLSIGVIAGQYAYNPGVGIELTSPALLKSFHLRVKGTTEWLEQSKVITNKWSRYYSWSTSIVYDTKLFDRQRGYVEAGTFAVLPQKNISGQYVQGLYGLVGLEFFILNKTKYNISYYFAGGLGHINAYAEMLDRQPSFGNGFIFTNGLRIYF